MQVSSSSEDAADDKDDDFEPEGKNKRSKKQPVKNKAGNAADVSSVSIPFTKGVVNPRNPSAEMKQFLVEGGLTWAIYELQCKELTQGDGTMVLNDNALSLNFKRRNSISDQGFNKFFWENIDSMRSSGAKDAGKRDVVFQTNQVIDAIMSIIIIIIIIVIIVITIIIIITTTIIIIVIIITITIITIIITTTTIRVWFSALSWMACLAITPGLERKTTACAAREKKTFRAINHSNRCFTAAARALACGDVALHRCVTPRAGLL